MPPFRPPFKLLALAAALVSASAFAQSQSSDDAVQLDTVTINASLDAARNDLSPSTGSSSYRLTDSAVADLPLGSATPLNQVVLQAPGVAQDSFGQLHVRGDHGNLQYRIDGIIIPEGIDGFGQSLSSSIIGSLSLVTGALPAQYGLHTAGIIDITTAAPDRVHDGGVLSMTAGSRGTVEPELTLWGSSGRASWLISGDYLVDDEGIENPTADSTAIHDRTWQRRGFAELSYVLNDTNRLILLSGVSNNAFQIPNNPGQQPSYSLAGVGAYPSSDLNETQTELTRFSALSLQGRAGATNYQFSVGQQYSEVDFNPDPIGDLIYNGLAAQISRTNTTDTLQADLSTRIAPAHLLSYGFYADRQSAQQDNVSQTFPADAQGNQLGNVPITIIDDSQLQARTFSTYVQDHWSVTDRLVVNGGLRWDQIGGYLSENQLSPRLGMVYALSDAWTLHSGYARYFTPPATELISSTDIAAFQGTTAALPSGSNTNVSASRTNYYDAGVQWHATPALSLGLDGYLSRSTDLLDEGQFGTALVFSDFNYARGRDQGLELTAAYAQGPLHANFNLAYSHAQGMGVASGQYNFSADELSYIATHWIDLDHDQTYTSSGNMSWTLDDGTKLGADYLFGSGLRAGFANTLKIPAYFQLNLSAGHAVELGSAGKVDVSLSIINVLDRSYELRDGTGIGVGAPQYGPRRGFYIGLTKYL